MTSNALFITVAGLCGAAGVALSAVAAHAGGGNTGTAATMLLVHAPALLALGLAGADRGLRIAGWVLFAGLVLFAGDLLVRELGAPRLFPFAAPGGGLLMIAGWLGIAASGLRRAIGGG